MAFKKKKWVNVPDSSNLPSIPEGQDALARFDAENMNRIEEGIEEVVNKCNGLTAEKIGALPITGGQLTGSLFIHKAVTPALEFDTNKSVAQIIKNASDTVEDGLIIKDCDRNTITTDYVTLRLNHNLAKEDIKQMLKVSKVEGGKSTFYNIYGEHNNPTAKDVGAIAETIYIEDKDILGIVDDGWYYGVKTINVPTTNTAGYIKVATKTGDASYREVYWRPHNSLTEYVNVLSGEDGWLGWTEILTNKGGVLNDNLMVYTDDSKTPQMGVGKNDNKCMTITYEDDKAYIVNRANGRSTSLSLENMDGVDLKQVLRLCASDGAVYDIFGKHNKPIQDYNGTGNATEQRIAVGGIGNTVCVYSNANNFKAIVTPAGAIACRDGSSCYGITRMNCRFENGELILATNDSAVNASNYTYYCQVL